MSVVALCEAVTALLGKDCPPETIAMRLTAELQRCQSPSFPVLNLTVLGLAVAAVLELSREKANSTEQPINESTCESVEPSEPTRDEIYALLEALNWPRDDPSHYRKALDLIRALDARRRQEWGFGYEAWIKTARRLREKRNEGS